MSQLTDVLKEFIINVDFHKNGKSLFKATTAVGFVGILHAVKPGKFAWSMDARRKVLTYLTLTPYTSLYT
jgi:hypothetical protein